MQLNHDENQLFMMLEPVCLFKSLYNFGKMMLKNIAIYHDVLLVVAKEIKFIDFEVNTFFFSKSFDDWNYRLNDLGLLVDFNVWDNFHDIVAERGKLFSIDIFTQSAFLLDFFDELDWKIFHKLANLISKIKKDSIGLDKTIQIRFGKIELWQVHFNKILF